MYVMLVDILPWNTMDEIDFTQNIASEPAMAYGPSFSIHSLLGVDQKKHYRATDAGTYPSKRTEQAIL